MTDLSIPADAEYVRTTSAFTDESVPPGLLARHQVAAGAWALLKVLSGELSFVFDDDTEDEERPSRRLRAGDAQAIPPARYHHLVIEESVSFEIEFYRIPS